MALRAVPFPLPLPFILSDYLQPQVSWISIWGIDTISTDERTARLADDLDWHPEHACALRRRGFLSLSGLKEGLE